MKKFFLFILVVLLGMPCIFAQNSETKNNPVGTWNFEAPYAPEGYTSGLIVVGVAEKKHTTTMSFTGSDYKIPGEQVKAINDSIIFSVYIEGQDVKVSLKVESETKMSGKAVYSEGEIPLTLSRSTDLK
jgi:hypothetical protein